MTGTPQSISPNHGELDDIVTLPSSTNVLSPKSSATIREFEIAFVESCRKALSQRSKNDEPLLINLEDCNFVELATWQYILSIFKLRQENGSKTYLNVPKGTRGRRARDYMRLAGFPIALLTLTGIEFRSILTSDSLQYWGEDPSESFSNYDQYFTGSGFETVRRPSKYFYPIHTWNLVEYIDKRRLVESASSSWGTSEVSNVLRSQLAKPRGPEGYVGRTINPKDYVEVRIIYEAIVNASRHSDAQAIQTSSHFERKRTLSPLFTIVVWDDGRNMYNTLRDTLERGDPIRLKYDPIYDRDYDLEVRDFSKKTIYRKRFCSSNTPTIDATDEELLLSAFYPGTTRDISGAGHQTSTKGLKGEDPTMRRPGMGLYAVIQCAVDEYGGSVAVRTGNLFMNIENPKHNRKVSAKRRSLRVTVMQAPEYFPHFRGNMLTIRLPLEKAAALS